MAGVGFGSSRQTLMGRLPALARWAQTGFGLLERRHRRDQRVGDGLPGWAYRTRTAKSIREQPNWICVTISPEVGPPLWRTRPCQVPHTVVCSPSITPSHCEPRTRTWRGSSCRLRPTRFPGVADATPSFLRARTVSAILCSYQAKDIRLLTLAIGHCKPQTQ